MFKYIVKVETHSKVKKYVYILILPIFQIFGEKKNPSTKVWKIIFFPDFKYLISLQSEQYADYRDGCFWCIPHVP